MKIIDFIQKYWRRILYILAACLSVYVIAAVSNLACNLNLRYYIDTLETIEYPDDRVVPQVEDGYMTVRKDGDIKIMQISDIHLGGGFWTYKKDKKSIYEVYTMMKEEKPDFVVLGGDNVYAVPLLGWNGGNTLDNKLVTETLIHLFEKTGVYYTTVFGNHDAETFNYYNRSEIGELFEAENNKYSIYQQDFCDEDAGELVSVTNQCIVLKNTDGRIKRLVLLLDTNSYIDLTLYANFSRQYDVVHEAQIEWAKGVIIEQSEKAGLPEGEYLKSLLFIHIPLGEYQTAYEEIVTEIRDSKRKKPVFRQNEIMLNTIFVEGSWDEASIDYGGGGTLKKNNIPNDNDRVFEELALDMGSVDAIFCGHDHLNNAVLNYRGVLLSYNYSIDNTAYGKIYNYGLQRGATVITVDDNGAFSQQHKNAYLDYHCEPDKYYDVDLMNVMKEKEYRTGRSFIE